MSVLLFLIVLVVLVLVHEFGHFIVAKKFGIRVDEFGIGFPPRAAVITKKGETTYTLNWLPFGGFVKIFGENPNDESISGPDSNRSFVHKSRWIQAAVLSAGVLMNILFAWFLFWIVFMLGAPTALEEEDIPRATDVKLIISEVLLDSPAELAGVLAGDEIVSLMSEGEGLVSNTLDGVIGFIGAHENSAIEATLRRGDSEISVTMTPVTGLISDAPDKPALGIAMRLVGLGLVGPIRHNPLDAFIESAKFTISVTILIGKAITIFLADIILLQADLSTVAGPVGIVGLVGDASALGLIYLLNFTALISINLAIINLLPFPALDGGRLLFVAIEAIKGSPIKPVVANTLNFIGFILLILLMLVVTFNDIARIFS